MKKYSFLGPLLAVAFPYFVFEAFHSGLFKNWMITLPKGHFYIVSLVSILASIFAIAVGVAGRRIRNIKISFLSLSFLSIGIMFSIHGLSTPHFILGISDLPGITAQLSMILATFWIYLSSIPSDNPIVEFFTRVQWYLVPVWTVALSGVCLMLMMNDHIVHFLPLNSKPLNIILTCLTLLLNGVTIYRYYQSYRFTRFPLQIAIVYSSGWLLVSQLIMVRGVLWSFSWWIYHFLLLAAMIVMMIGLVKQYAVKGTLSESIRSLFTNDPIERITNSIGPSVKALVTATNKKDAYTAGHTFRVTMYALKLAEELHLNPEQQRAIVQGGLVHDVGKISVPDPVLNKPGKLSPDERRLIERHPIDGYEMCRGLGFMKEELGIIRSHHEKWDGSGYPDKLKGKNIPYFARIMAVVDVYDALTSERPYRKAWGHAEAMKFITDNKGTHFDPECVHAWEQLCIRNPSVYQYPAHAIKDQPTIRKISSIN
ncbi:HD-GYP domain-containing protein [Bacillus sp. sid0103]|uniref:HD domain-containing phosphohydrolase n=1 Tax=Bacillus sp. sid0103 TaxID=2856337 RepID=UPI001C496733|nr:HD domain-containing phosphohydrolase [Bacillus sp. sid0103]MBV7506393.1 HD-GYP domain-containing protein [Bacillus sp. sid0103]